MSASAAPTTTPRRLVWRAEASTLTGALLSAPAVLIVLVLVGYPVVLIIANTLGLSGRSALSDVLTSNSDQKALIRTVRVSLLVTVLSVGFGVMLAWALTTIRSRGWKLVVWVAVLAPFWMSVVVKNYAFVLLLRQGGPVQDLLAKIGIIGSSTSLLYTEGAVVVGMLYAMLPYAVLPLYATFSRLDHTMISAAESMGAGRLRALWTVVVPLCARGILAAGTLVFIISLGFYVTPIILGGPTAPFAASAIGTALFEFFNLDEAKALAVVLLTIAFIAAIASQLVSRYVLKGEDR
jgi:ABC-type spermidine/putrescine transport system permease subunit I